MGTNEVPLFRLSEAARYLDGKIPYPFFGCDAAVQTEEESFVENVKAPEPILIHPIVGEEELSTLKNEI